MTTFDKIIEYTKNKFPDFEFDAEIDNQTSIVIFLINRLKKSIEEKNQRLTIKLVNFINSIVSNENESTTSLIDDIALTIYTEGCYKNIEAYLTKEANDVFEININLWKKGNQGVVS